MAKRKPVETSLEAHASLSPINILEVHLRIMDALRIIGSGTYEDIARQAKLEPQRVWKRLSETLKAGVVYRTGEKKPLKSGRNGFVWALTTPGTPSLPVTEKAMPGKGVNDYAKQIIQQSTLF